MTGLSNNTVIGITKEVTPGTFNAPSTSDLLVVADLRPNIQGLTSEINEYTGSIHKPGAKVGGATFEISGRALLRGPGGSGPPASDAFVLGRLLQAMGFTETRVNTAIPSSPETVGAGGSTSSVQLGSTATGTADLYNGYAVQLAAGLGSSPKNIAQILDYSAGKVATLGEVAGGALTSGNYQLLKQLVYVLATATPPTLSASCWVGGRRYDGAGLSMSSFRINLPTFSRESTEYPSIEFTLSGNLEDSADENAPTPTITLAVPPFKDGKLWVANTQVGGSSMGIDFNAQIAYPPNPNEVTGSESAVLTQTTRSVNLTLNQLLASELDLIAVADNQAYHSIIAQYGLASGNYVLCGVPAARFNYFSPDNGGALVNDTGTLFVDDAASSVLLSFPYFT